MRNKRQGMRQAELAILNAPFEDAGWERAVASIAHATRSSAAQLLGLGGPLLMPLSVVAGSFGRHERNFRDPALHGACNWRVGTTTVPMAIQHEAHYAAYRASHDTGLYDDVASDMDIQFGCQSALMLGADQMLGLALLRARRDGPCDGEVLDRFAYLRTHLARAVRMQLALDGEAAELMIGDTAALHGATVLLDRHGTVAALTPAAETAFDEGGPLLLAGLGVHLRDPARDRGFQGALAHLLASEANVSTPVHQLVVRAGLARWRLCAMRLPERQHGLGFDPHIALALKRLP